MLAALSSTAHAEDMFDAHQKCEVAAKKLGNSFGGISDTVNFKHEFLSHYDPKTGNCYLKYTRTNMKTDYTITDQLYDVHSGEFLAQYTTQKDKPTYILNDESYTSTQEFEKEMETYYKNPKMYAYPSRRYIDLKMSAGR
jgi:hypothetical protein